MAVFNEHSFTVCGVKFLYDGPTPPEGTKPEYTYAFARSITLSRTEPGQPDIVARTMRTLPQGITRVMHDFEGNPDERVQNGTAWLVFHFTERARQESRERFVRVLDIALTNNA